MRNHQALIAFIIYISCVFAQSQSSDTILIDKSTQWWYLDDDTNPGVNWTVFNFDHFSWDRGRPYFGTTDERKNGGYTTLLESSIGQAYPTYYFRTFFELEQPELYSQLNVLIDYDDAFSISINDVPVQSSSNTINLKDHLSAGCLEAGHNSLIDDEPPQTTPLWINLSVDKLALKPGRNVIAVAIKQCNQADTDAAFDLKMEAVIRRDDKQVMMKVVSYLMLLISLLLSYVILKVLIMSTVLKTDNKGKIESLKVEKQKIFEILEMMRLKNQNSEIDEEGIKRVTQKYLNRIRFIDEKLAVLEKLDEKR